MVGAGAWRDNASLLTVRQRGKFRIWPLDPFRRWTPVGPQCGGKTKRSRFRQPPTRPALIGFHEPGPIRIQENEQSVVFDTFRLSQPVLPEVRLEGFGISRTPPRGGFPAGDDLSDRQADTQFNQNMRMVGHHGGSQDPAISFPVPSTQNSEKHIAGASRRQPRRPILRYQCDEVQRTGIGNPSALQCLGTLSGDFRRIHVVIFSHGRAPSSGVPTTGIA